MRARWSSPVDGNSSVERSVPESTKRMCGKAIAMRLTISVMAAASAFSVLRNFNRAGVAKNRSRTSTIVPVLAAAGRTVETLPPVTDMMAPSVAPCARLVIVSLATEPIEGRASPRKPSVRISLSVEEIFDVQCLRIASSRSGVDMPQPLSVMRTRPFPPPAVAISIRVAPASMAFSMSSLAALDGRSITSPAAIWLIRVSESCLMDMLPFSRIRGRNEREIAPLHRKRAHCLANPGLFFFQI